MKISKSFPVAFVYFFINAVALPFGLTFTALLSPFFYAWVIIHRRKEVLLPWFVSLSPFIIIHFLNGTDSRSYLLSVVNYTAVYIFCQAFYTFLKTCKHPEGIFRKLLVINFACCLAAIPVYFSDLKPLLWMESSLVNGVAKFDRLKLFTYEASYYAALFTPLFLFYLLQIVFKQNTFNTWLLLLLIVTPYLLSFSIGVLGSLLFALLVTFLVFCKTLIVKKRVVTMLVLACFGTTIAGVSLWLFYPNTTLLLRMGDILSGNDTSGKGRTSEAFMLAQQILDLKSSTWGVGAGQIKILGGDIIRSYYLYPLDYSTIAIPNAAAETMAIFGWVGLVIRLLAEFFFFFHTRVWRNYYRILLFVFIFIYQFTGSFITNIAEYVIWILAFTNAFPQFDVRKNNRVDIIHTKLLKQ